MAVSTAELLGGRKSFVLATPKSKRSRGEAWDFLMNNPPVISIDGKVYVPVRAHSFFALAKCHNATHWRWSVFKWEPLEDSYYKEALTEEKVKQLLEQYRKYT